MNNDKDLTVYKNGGGVRRCIRYGSIAAMQPIIEGGTDYRLELCV